MPHDFSLRRPPAGARWAGPLFLCALGALTLAGCEEEGVHQYAAPKAEAPEKVRLLGVIYPHGDLTWFFKLMGPESAVAGQADAIDDFMKSIHFTGNGDKPIEWKLPDGWQPVADAKAPPERYATLRIEAKDTPSLDLIVTKFPGAVGGVLANVNRWRGQVGLPPIGADELDKVTRKEKLNGDDVTIVKLVGPGAKAHSGAPFMSLPGAAPDSPPFHYARPEGWEESDNLVVKGIRRAAVFKASEGGGSVEISVTAMGGNGGGFAANVDRWRGQVGMKPTGEVREGDFPAVEVAGASVPLIDTGEGADRERIVGAAVPHGGQTWFFKMQGPADGVEKQIPRFKDFLKSVKFDGDKGGEE